MNKTPGTYRKICEQNNAIDQNLGWRAELKITCPVGAHMVCRRDFLPSEGMCGDCFIVYSSDMEKLADERDEARSEHEEYITATT
jgi:hypothetical protein